MTMKKILIINGPNLNLLGNREKKFYGNISLEKIKSSCIAECKKNNMEPEFFQSNHEGELIEKIHSVQNGFEGIIINPAAYTHTSIALLDALRATTKPKIEVHVSNIYAREEFRQKSLLSPNCKAVICGLGLASYKAALLTLKD